MKRSRKESFIVEFAARLEQSPVFYITDFSGLPVKAMTRLRRELRAAGSEYMVVKNRLALRVLADQQMDHEALRASLKGPTGVIVVDGEPVAPAKALAEFAKQHGDRPVFKVGYLEHKVVAAAQFERLTKLPSREQLLAELAGALEAPMQSLASVLQAKLQETSGLLDALREKKAAE